MISPVNPWNEFAKSQFERSVSAYNACYRMLLHGATGAQAVAALVSCYPIQNYSVAHAILKRARFMIRRGSHDGEAFRWAGLLEPVDIFLDQTPWSCP